MGAFRVRCGWADCWLILCRLRTCVIASSIPSISSDSSQDPSISLHTHSHGHSNEPCTLCYPMVYTRPSSFLPFVCCTLYFGLFVLIVGSKFPCFIFFSASLPSSNPRLRICPAEGASSRGVDASRFRYAAWRAEILRACIKHLHLACGLEKYILRFVRLCLSKVVVVILPLSGGAGTRSNLPARAGTWPCPCRSRSWC